MSHSFNTFALKLKVHCKDCRVELEKELLKLKGVCSVKIDQKLGKALISGKVDPAKILSQLEKRGREAELWPCEQLEVNDPLNDSDIMVQLEELSYIPGLHTVEVTKTTKLTFPGQPTSKNPRITQSKVLSHGGRGQLCYVSSSCCGCHHGNTSFGSCYANNRNNYSDHNVPSAQSEVLAHGGGLCSASSSCCGGHSGNYTLSGSCCVNNRNSYCNHNVPITQSEFLAHGGGLCSASSSCCGGHSGNHTSFGSSCGNNRNNYCYHCTRPQPMEYRYIPGPRVIPPPWSGDRPIPSAPPLPSDYFQPPASPPAFSWVSFILKCLKYTCMAL